MLPRIAESITRAVAARHGVTAMARVTVITTCARRYHHSSVPEATDPRLKQG
jgi:hypothetical protein